MTDTERKTGLTPSPMMQLLEIMARLRDPDSGCPWDRAQNFASIASYTIEEAYEVADAIERGDRNGLLDELGDLLFQIVFYAQIATEEGSFDFDDVARTISDKMVRRHPHVFDAPENLDLDFQHQTWE
ncbi:MAG: nucleoside triphosphate pyrophosphohydrolase, partial [Rhodospirillales bacterium]|nr:nucleoside triphosphate pyrophosphohydrolase [Rhodospirillales bacterium]